MLIFTTMYTLTRFILPLLLAGSFPLGAQTDARGTQPIPNPVLPRVADAGVLKYNGKYYIGGVHTDGDFYVSDDLVHWEAPVHAVTMDNEWTRGTGAGNNQIHANDLIYLNGDFHLYWSVNYWGKDRHAVHITHAQSQNVLGPYTEPDKKQWMDNRIDPHIFRDDDGQLYMYMVRFTDGNTIWGRKMKNPSEFAGEPVCQFASLPATWETMDNRVAEGPWVIKYRNRYYMMYNANHTATEWGNYQLGVAEAESPLAFQHGGKYSYPVVGSNQTALEENHPDLLRYTPASYAPLFDYTEQEPAGDWTSLHYPATGWQKGKGGFASEKTEGSTSRPQGTVWSSPSLWIRKSFTLPKDRENLALRIAHDGDTEIYINGKPIYRQAGADYRIVNLEKKLLDAFREGENILAVKTRKGRRNYFDISLFDMGDKRADDILYTPGQPNLVKGPNGFEWWLVYMANKDKEPRGQYIDRVHFFNKTLYVDGITGPRTEGYHPVPASATYSDTFDSDRTWQQTGNGWKKDGWTVKEGELYAPESRSSDGLPDRLPAATAYLFEAGIRTSGQAGLIAWWKDTDHWVRIGLDSERKCWFLRSRLQGKEEEHNFALPGDFRFGVYHSFTIERNADCLKVRLDGIPAPGQSRFSGLLPAHEKGIPGLFARTGQTAFDGLIYTIGFDDYDTEMPGWEAAGNTYEVTSEGLAVRSNGPVEAFKGDKLDAYEYTFQVSGLSEEGIAGGYPVYVDKDNYIRTVFNGKTRTLDIIRMKNGRSTTESLPLARTETVYPDIKYTDFIEKGYRFPALTYLDAIELNRHEVDRPEQFEERMSDKFHIEYASQGQWYPLSGLQTGKAGHPAYEHVAFTPVQTAALRFINRNPEDLQRHIYKIRVHTTWKDSYHLRAVKKEGRLYLFVDGRETGCWDIDDTPSRVGLYSDNGSPVFNGILLYHLGK